jgi:hypothetical protein
VTGVGSSRFVIPLDGYPALYRSQLDNLLVSGATDGRGCGYDGSQEGKTLSTSTLVETYASGYAAAVANSIGTIKP